ncbi:MAG: DUF5305 family protein [Bacilli bacterium]
MRTKKNKEDEIFKNTFPNKFYLGFKARVILLIIAFSLCFACALIFLQKSLEFKEVDIINYKETSDLDYKVYLKKNDFYDEKYLEKDMLYVASLIDNVKINFNYNFNIDNNIPLKIDYKIIGKLLIENETEDKTYFQKDYDLVSKKDYKLKNNKIEIDEKIKIDYDYYNDIANKFKMSYGINTKSFLKVFLIVDKFSSENKISIPKNSIMYVSIPLSEKSVSIKLSYNKINESNNIVDNSNIVVKNLPFIAITIILVITSIILIIKIVRMISLMVRKKTKYDKYISKLLIKYDRVIAENSTGPILENKQIIKIKKFEELLDVRDNLKLPILYYNTVPHQKCCFYIIHDSELYMHVVKAVDLEVRK